MELNVIRNLFILNMLTTLFLSLAACTSIIASDKTNEVLTEIDIKIAKSLATMDSLKVALESLDMEAEEMYEHTRKFALYVLVYWGNKLDSTAESELPILIGKMTDDFISIYASFFQTINSAWYEAELFEIGGDGYDFNYRGKRELYEKSGVPLIALAYQSCAKDGLTRLVQAGQGESKEFEVIYDYFGLCDEIINFSKSNHTSFESFGVRLVTLMEKIKTHKTKVHIFFPIE